MQSKAPLTLILSPLRAGRGELERTCLGSLFGDPDTVPSKVPLSLRKREREAQASDWCLANGCWANSGTGLLERRWTILPLPRGEGRGEGQSSIAHPTPEIGSGVILASSPT